MARKSWNIALDVCMVGRGEGITYGLLPGVQPELAAIVTRDSNSDVLRTSAEMRVLVDLGTEKLPYFPFGMDTHKDLSSGILRETFALDPSSAAPKRPRASAAPGR